MREELAVLVVVEGTEDAENVGDEGVEERVLLFLDILFFEGRKVKGIEASCAAKTCICFLRPVSCGRPRPFRSLEASSYLHLRHGETHSLCS